MRDVTPIMQLEPRRCGMRYVGLDGVLSDIPLSR